MFFARVKPASHMEKPACIKNTKAAPIKTHIVLTALYSINNTSHFSLWTSIPIKHRCRGTAARAISPQTAARRRWGTANSSLPCRPQPGHRAPAGRPSGAGPHPGYRRPPPRSRAGNPPAPGPPPAPQSARQSGRRGWRASSAACAHSRRSAPPLAATPAARAEA